jgi:hypothetical protein
MRSYSFLFNIYGTVALVGGVVFGLHLLAQAHYAAAGVGQRLIALGGLSPALGGTLARIRRRSSCT